MWVLRPRRVRGSTAEGGDRYERIPYFRTSDQVPTNVEAFCTTGLLSSRSHELEQDQQPQPPLLGLCALAHEAKLTQLPCFGHLPVSYRGCPLRHSSRVAGRTLSTFAESIARCPARG